MNQSVFEIPYSDIYGRKNRINLKHFHNTSMSKDIMRYIQHLAKQHCNVSYIIGAVSALRHYDRYLHSLNREEYRRYMEIHGDYFVYLNTITSPNTDRPYANGTIRNLYYAPMLFNHFLDSVENQNTEGNLYE